MNSYNLFSSAQLGIASLIIALFSGVPGLFLRTRPPVGQRLAATLMIISFLSGTAAAFMSFSGAAVDTTLSPATSPFGEEIILGVDALTALFIPIILLISACASLYACRYWPAASNRKSEPRLTFYFGVLTASLITVVMARDCIVFLVGWEIMALSCFFAMTLEDSKREVREAGKLYLIATHIATLTLFVTFSLIYVRTGSFLLPPEGSLSSTAVGSQAIFFTALVAFGIKAGMMPLHIWLPAAHAAAPSHVSALMSGMLIKMGIYGLLRIVGLFHDPPLSWGLILITIGICSGVLGVIFALGQHDIKRLLAYHSIENIGIITIGIGAALVGISVGNPTVTILAGSGALLHIANHAIFKSLLFFSAGATIHASGTRNLDELGGLSRTMPLTSLMFLTGAIAICGLPPLNGFISEFLIYLSLFRGIFETSSKASAAMALAIPAMAIIGGLAVAGFIKVYSTAFLGSPRSRHACVDHDPPWSMTGPMIVLAFSCLFIGILPMTVAPLLQRSVASWTGTNPAPLSVIAQLPALSAASGLSLLITGLLLTLFLFLFRKNRASTTVTWSCGYLGPTSRMQYTSSSFAEMFLKIFRGILHTRWTYPAINGPFPKKSTFSSHVPETFLELLVIPFCSKIEKLLSTVRRLQHGQLHLYILYIFIVAVGLFLWSHQR